MKTSSNCDLGQFTNQYSLSKTLRFELRPQGKTLEYIQQKGLLQEDEIRAEKYKQVKKLLDEYHKQFIADALEGFSLKDLDVYQKLYVKNPKEKKDQDDFEKLQKVMRKQIADKFKEYKKLRPLDGAELFHVGKKSEAVPHLLELVKSLSASQLSDLGFEEKEDAAGVVNEFGRFTTYFTGFHQNRANMYSDEAQGTAISHRLINENLPRFIDNISSFKKVIEAIKDCLPKLSSDLEGAIDEQMINAFFVIEGFNDTLTQK